MPVLDDPKWEKFAQGIAAGLVYRIAYLEAGYTPSNLNTNRSCASQLLARQEIRDRVTELQDELAEKTLVTRESCTKELEEARRLAMSDPKGAAAAVSAVMGKAKLHGLDVNKHEVKGGVTVMISSDDDRL